MLQQTTLYVCVYYHYTDICEWDAEAEWEDSLKKKKKKKKNRKVFGVRSPFISKSRLKSLLFDVVVLFHLLAIADKIYRNHCAPWSVEVLIKYAFP